MWQVIRSGSFARILLLGGFSSLWSQKRKRFQEATTSTKPFRISPGRAMARWGSFIGSAWGLLLFPLCGSLCVAVWMVEISGLTA